MHQTVASVLSEKAMTHLRLSKSAPALHIRNSVPQPVLNSLAQPSHSTAQSLSVAGPYLKLLTRGSACFNMFFVSSQGSFLPVGSHPWQVYDECQCCLVRTCCARSANMLMDDVWFFDSNLRVQESMSDDVDDSTRLRSRPGRGLCSCGTLERLRQVLQAVCLASFWPGLQQHQSIQSETHGATCGYLHFSRVL